MKTSHYDYWPKRMPQTLSIPETTIYDNLVTTAKRYPNKEAIYYYGSTYTYAELLEEVDELAGFLEQELEVEEGDNVLLYMQNSPQYIISYYAILRANAVVVPINPMNTSDELSYYVQDCSIKVGIVGQELYDRVLPLFHTTTLKDIIIASYNDYLPDKRMDMSLPPEVAASRVHFSKEHHYLWKDALSAKKQPSNNHLSPNNLAVLPYTSGTTGLPKGCMHTHKTVQANTVGGVNWVQVPSDAVCLTTLPLFHVTGMVHSMHIPIFAGAKMVIMTRWDRKTARQLIKDQHVTHWVTISTMLIDFLAYPDLHKEDVKSLMLIAGGGAALPSAVGQKLYEITGLKFIEGYGLSETMAQTHFNPPDRPKLQCLGIPSFDVDARIIDPDTLKELEDGEEGEIIVNGPQVFEGYYNREEENEKVFLQIEGKTFFRTGDIGKRDEEGYYFIVDRVKRMINASGYKVWPTEVEGLLYKHPAVLHACVVGIPDEKRGETVKAFVVLHETYKGQVSENDIIEWSKEQMAAYKYPRLIEFRDELPMTTSGKLLWRKLQEEEREKTKRKNESLI